MLLKIIVSVLSVWAAVRTVSYGIYCFKETGKAGGISVFFLAAALPTAALTVIFL